MLERSMTSAFRALFILPALLALGGCERIQPVRTLPGWVRGVYIPMVKNETTEPGLEEILTRYTQEEFLADGRLQVVPRENADLKIVAKIRDYRVVVRYTDNDRFPTTDEIRMVTELQLFDPFDDEKPVADLGRILTNSFFTAELRSTNYTVKPDAQRNVLALLAREIVGRTINGFPVELKGLPRGAQPPILPNPGTGHQQDLFKNRTEILR